MLAFVTMIMIIQINPFLPQVIKNKIHDILVFFCVVLLLCCLILVQKVHLLENLLFLFWSSLHIYNLLQSMLENLLCFRSLPETI